jgi:hypothetical protein
MYNLSLLAHYLQTFQATIPYSARHHVILPDKHDVTRLIITDYHECLRHEGNVHVRNVIQQEY